MRGPNRARASRRGNATIVSILALLAIGGFAGVILSVSYRNSGETSAAVDQNQAFFAAEFGANAAIAELTASLEAADDPSKMGTADEPIQYRGGRYWIEVEPVEDDYYRVLSHGRSGLHTRTIEVMFRQAASQGPFQSAVFAGNSSEDGTYVMEFGGTGGSADWVNGNVYSGGSVDFAGDATVDGQVYATLSASGVGDAETGTKMPIPDLAAENYAATAEVQVADIFDSDSFYASDSKLGGSAWEVPEESPAHIFRKNPSDRTANTSSTVKDDYFLEDTYETNTSSAQFKITLSGVGGSKGTSSNQKVFFIDGNLWIHNHPTPSFKLQTGEGGVQVTFVVKGNVYLSDDFEYTNTQKDGVAFIAMIDPDVEDSGNIYFGDPVYGTLETMHGFMYAENNFYDNNLDDSGSASVELFGNMTAGNQVLIERDYKKTKKGKTTIYHTQMGIDFDDRMAAGDLTLPGIPKAFADEGSDLDVLSWREVGSD